MLEETFEGRDQLNEFLAREACWAILCSQNTTDGIKTVYRCNKAKRRGPQCIASIYTIHNSEPNDRKIYLFKKNRDHNHDQLGENKSSILSDEAKQRIIELHELKHHTKAIHFIMSRDEKFISVTTNQIRGAIASYKLKKYGSSRETMAGVEAFAQENMTVPDDEHKPYIIGFEKSADDDDDVWFRFAVSTKRLLKSAVVAKNFHVDSTYKIIIQNFPVSVIGCSDMNRRFHPLAIMVSTNEKWEDYSFLFKAVAHAIQIVWNVELQPNFLIADAAPAISKGFKHAFPNCNDSNIIMCWYHVAYNFNKHALKNNANRDFIKTDLNQLHLAYNESLFVIGWRLFEKKWIVDEPEFVEKFQGVFIRKNRNWFNGAGKTTPKTNNALEQFNGKMKIHQTFYQRKGIHEFKFSLLDIVGDHSREYIQAKDGFQQEVSISKKLWNSGLNYSKLDIKHLLTPPNENGTTNIFVLGNEDESVLSMEMLENFLEHNYDTFEEFSESAFHIHGMEFGHDPSKWKSATCTCPSFFQSFMCKHIIGIAHKLELIPPEPRVRDNTLIAPKQKRGRPRNTTKALVKE